MTLQRARGRDDRGALRRDALHRASEGEAQHYQWYGGPAIGRVSAEAARLHSSGEAESPVR